MEKIHIKNIVNLIELKEMLNKKLYSGHALITYDLILQVLKANLESRNLTIKELCAGSIRSTVNIRRHIDLMIENDLIFLSNGVHDKRLRLIHPTSKLIQLADGLFESKL